MTAATASAPDRRIGITTTVPSEVIYAAGLVPVDMNNVFISSPDPGGLVDEAERAGFPRNSCAWIKGIYAACRRAGLRRIVGVVRGDCSNTIALLEILRSEGMETIEFAYPPRRDPAAVGQAIADFAAALGTSPARAEEERQRLAPARALLAEADLLAWKTGQVLGREAHEWLVSSSDFRGDPEAFTAELAAFLSAARRRPSPPLSGAPLAIAGVPPICTGLFELLDRAGGHVVLDEMPLEFSMLSRDIPLKDLYYKYTYPYDVFYRAGRLAESVKARGARAVIHYVQSFCYRQLQDRLLRRLLPVPVLTLECDRPGPIDAGGSTRVEAFLESLRATGGGR